MRVLHRPSPLLGAATLLMAGACFSMARAQGRCAVPPDAPVHRGATDAAYREAGEWFLQQQRYSCAVETLQRAVELFPTSAPLHLALGTSLYSAGRAEASRTPLEKAVQLDPASVQARLALGAVDHDLGLITRALEQWQEVISLDPTSLTALDWVAKSRMEANQYTGAIDMLRTAPADESLQVDLLVAYSRSGMPDTGIAGAQAMLASHSEWSRLDAALAVVLAQRNRFQEASTLLERSLAEHPGDREIEMQYLRVLVIMGDLSKATPLAESFRSRHPNDFDALYLSGLLHRENGEYEAALKDLQAATAMKTGSYDVLYNLGTTLAKLHRAAEAREVLTRAAASPEAAPEAHFQLAGVLRTMGDAAGAQAEMQLHQEGLKRRARHDETVSLMTQASQKMASGDALGAVSLYRRIREGEPDNAQALFNLAMALDRVPDVKGEEEALRAAIRVRPDFAAAQNQLGFLCANSGRNNEAEAYFRKAIATAPQFAEAESNLGSLLAGEGHDAEAETLFHDALVANPRYTDAWINLAATLAGDSHFGEARAAARSALQIEPDNKAAAELLVALPPPNLAARP